MTDRAKEQEIDKITAERRGIFAHVQFVMDTKAQMIKGGDRAASKKCPFCEGRWHFILAGPRNHVHGYCDGPCKRIVME